ncbi:MAG: DinB family protein [Acidobacteriota bacterium]
MKMTELFLAQLEREAAKSRRALERVPEGRPDWKPHEKSMPLGYLSTLVGMIPEWIARIVSEDELDVKPKAGGKRPAAPGTNQELLALLDASVAKAQEALGNTDDEHLLTPWRLLSAGEVKMEQPRYEAIADTFTHLAHHRGQLTVYLRLNDLPVPSIYGPTADDPSFG